MNLLKQTISFGRLVFKTRFYRWLALVAALGFAYLNYWLFLQVTTIGQFISMTKTGDFGRFSVAYAVTYILLTVIMILLFGAAAAFTAWHWRHSRLGKIKIGSVGSFGAIFGAFGSACPICGAFLLQLLGVASGVAAFPLKGLEFKIASIGFLAFTTMYSAKKSAAAMNAECSDCEIPDKAMEENASEENTSRPAEVLPKIFSIESMVTAVLIIVLTFNHFMIGQAALAMGLKTTGLSAIANLFKPSAAAAKQIISTKLNPDGRTTTLGSWPTITEVPAEPNTGDTVADARVVMVPTGVPFYAPEGISFDDGEGSLERWQSYESQITLDGALESRFEKIISTMTCDYCCGGPTRVTHINNCGCRHAQAWRSIAKYLLKNYGDKYSDEEILGELQRWKGVWYPKGVIEDYLLATGRGNVLGHANHGGAGSDGMHGFKL
ncbi:MAG: hypothetical protein HW383_106 [Candidatus Magasanikbacteria bacterium]|nr:hypothetical protein [Candidatus Magasanikbacteria bacterium]